MVSEMKFSLHRLDKDVPHAVENTVDNATPPLISALFVCGKGSVFFVKRFFLDNVGVLLILS